MLGYGVTGERSCIGDSCKDLGFSLVGGAKECFSDMSSCYYIN